MTEVQAMVENHLKDMILKTFDPKKADTIFTEEGEVSNLDNEQMILNIVVMHKLMFDTSTFPCFALQTPAWLTEMIEHPTWRSLIYRLAEEYPDCLMLNFTIKVKPYFYF